MAVSSNVVRKLPSLGELSSALQEKGKLHVDAGQGSSEMALSPTKSASSQNSYPSCLSFEKRADIGRLQMPARSIGAAPPMARSFTTNSIPTLTRRGSIPTLAAIEQRFSKPDPIMEHQSVNEQDLSAASMQKSKSSGDAPSTRDSLQPGAHPLQHGWTFYADTKQTHGKPPPSPLKAKNKSGEAYTASMACIGKVQTVESFARLFNWMKRPTSLSDKANLMCFKDDIAPMWEDAANENGGKWTISFSMTRSRVIDQAWLDLILALIGGHLDEHDIVTGIVANVRARGNRIQIWISNKKQTTEINALGRNICAILGGLTDGQGIGLDFTAHSGGLASAASTSFIHVKAMLQDSMPLLSRSNSVPNMQARPNNLMQPKPLGFSGFMPPMSPTKRVRLTESVRRQDRANAENVPPV